MSALSVGEKCS